MTQEENEENTLSAEIEQCNFLRTKRPFKKLTSKGALDYLETTENEVKIVH